jgi:carbamate kinase
MRVVVALGGNALLKRGQPMTEQAQRENVRVASVALAEIAQDNELVVTHGNGPQVGLLALQGNAYKPDELYPLDVLGAETEGMIGYMIEQELGNLMPVERPFATLLTMIEVDPVDPAFNDPTKFIGPVYDEELAHKLASENNWSIKQDGDKWRRVVASPTPKRIFELNPIKWLLDKNTIVVCAGGGGIPTAYDKNQKLCGIEAVIDKDFATELLARELQADLFVMATDADGVYIDWGKPSQKLIKTAHPNELKEYEFAAGSMGPKVEAACQFALLTGKDAAIGSLDDLNQIANKLGGTTITTKCEGMTFYD